MEKLTFKVNEYEGPLDLILALLSKHQIDNNDINISDLLEQYMGVIRTLQESDMEVASELLEMASRLVNIKTVSLLPRCEKEDDPRAELVGQLLEYQSCKQAAALLRLRDSGWAVFTREPMPLEIAPTYRRHHPIGELTNAYWAACGRGRRRLPPQERAGAACRRFRGDTRDRRTFLFLLFHLPGIIRRDPECAAESEGDRYGCTGAG